MPVERRPDFKKALSTLQQLKKGRRSSTTSTLGTVLLLLLHGGAGKVHGGLFYESHHGDEPSTE